MSYINILAYVLFICFRNIIILKLFSQFFALNHIQKVII